ncbi:Putative ribonuclease H protein At1g65750, partial [Linum grandiflorum]
WSIPLSTTLRGGALVEWNHLLHRLESLPSNLVTAGPSFIVWPLEKSDRFSVRSLRQAQVEAKFPGCEDFPFDVWPKRFPPKIQTFCWKVFHKRIATSDNLQKRGFSLSNWCVLCHNDMESVDHIMLQCNFMASIWIKICSALSIYGPLLEDTRDFIRSWKGMNCRPCFRVAMNGIMHATFWFFWLERNDRIFNGKNRSRNEVYNRILLNVGRWVSAADLLSTSQLRQWNRFVFDPG